MKKILGSFLTLTAITTLFVGCADMNGFGDQGWGGGGGRRDPYYSPPAYSPPPPRYDGYYPNDDWRRDRDREEQHRLDRERDRLERERHDIEEQRERERNRDRDNGRGRDNHDNNDHRRPENSYSPPPPPARVQEHCPSGFQPSENKCSNEDRKHGCKDMRLHGGLGCVHR